MRICLEVWGPDPNRLVAIAQHAEEGGLDGVYLGESPTALNAETWTTLGAVAAATDRIRFGPVIANLLPTYRSPVLLARQGAALAALGRGRFDFRTGVGAGTDAARPWWRPAGVDYPGHAERLAEADRQLGVLRTLWSGGAVDLGDGPYRLGLEHPPIEITVAASGAPARDLAARHADRWETSFATIEEWASRRRAAPTSRSSLEIDAFVGPASDPGRGWRSAVADRAGEDLDALRARALVGGPDAVASQLAALEQAGLDQLVVALHEPDDPESVDALGAAVARHRDPDASRD